MVLIFSIDTFGANHGRGGVISPVHIRGAGRPWLSPSRGGELVIISGLLRNLWAMPDLTKQMFKQLYLVSPYFLSNHHHPHHEQGVNARLRQLDNLSPDWLESSSLNTGGQRADKLHKKIQTPSTC